jgi:hypothetical protein
MTRIEFRADSLEDQDELRDWSRRDDAPHAVSRWLAWTGAVAGLLYVTHFPGTFEISTPQAGGVTNARFIDVTGTVDNPRVASVALEVNGSYRSASVENGRFASRVPLVRGENVIRATVSGAAALVTPGSNIITITADLPRSDIWSELTWDGPGDLDLHLYLPGMEHIFWKNRKSAVGAFLDFDNQVSDGPEHIVMDTAIPGQYRMTVHYFKASAPGPVRWRARLLLRDGAVTQEFSGVLTTPGEETEFWMMDWPSE